MPWEGATRPRRVVLLARLPPGYRICRCHTDAWPAYAEALPDWQHAPRQQAGPTNHVERFNATLRARLGRLVRKTLSFAKSQLMLEISIRLFLHQYNRASAPKFSATFPASVATLSELKFWG